MMFNGAQKYGPKMFDRVMEAKGGSNNAYTSENLTVYTDFFPIGTMEVVFDLEADRIAHLALDDKMVESERGVILAERITGMENSNFELLYEQVKGAAFLVHPYRWDIIGYESDIRNWRKSDLQTYFDTYYAPNNAVVVMAGDVTLERVKELTREYFEPIPARTPPRPVHAREPEQLGEKRVYVNRNVSSPNVLVVYHVPETGSPDYYALDMLDSILGKGKSSRLYKALIDEKQLATDVFTFIPESLDPHLFHISAICAKDVDEDTLEKAIYEELDKIIKDGVTEQELQKVKNRKLVGFYRAMETINGKADTIGNYEIFFGGFEKLFNAPEEYRKVTAEDIKRVAATYLKKSNRTVGILKNIEEK
jgi:predicted Zn-dependent peptidase